MKIRVKNTFLPYFAVSVAIVCVLLVFGPKSQRPSPALPSFPTDYAYDSKSFLPAIASIKTDNTHTSPKVIVTPHHLTASPIIAKAISSLFTRRVDTVFIFSPNHNNQGNCDIVTSSKNWSTPYGTIEVNKSLQEQISSSKTFCYDDTAFEGEHGVAGLLPFLKYLSPDTKIVPFIIKKYIDPSNLDLFINSLNNLDSHNVAFISSIDFSHGLSLNMSKDKDSITERLIKDKNYPQILTLTQENVDSPPSLVIAMKLSEHLGTDLSVVDHRNSSDFNNSTTSVTTYFFLANKSTEPSPHPSVPISTTITTSPPKSDSKKTTTLIFTGDVMLGRSVNTRMIKYQDYTWPFKNTANFLSSADLTIINLEAPIKPGCNQTDSGMVFCADPKSIVGLQYAGVDIAGISNNHILNQGQMGLDDTISLLQKASISVFGTNKPLYKTVNNTKIGFLGFNDIGGSGKNISVASPENIKSLISEAKKNAQFVVASFHWGNEYSQKSARQTELAKLAVDNGADLIIGHHPHWVQTYEEYKGKPIYYSLGNFVFDQMWSSETRKGLVVKITLQDDKIVKQEKLQVQINDYGQPIFIN